VPGAPTSLVGLVGLILRWWLFSSLRSPMVAFLVCFSARADRAAVPFAGSLLAPDVFFAHNRISMLCYIVT